MDHGQQLDVAEPEGRTNDLLRTLRPGPPARWPNKVSLTLDDDLLAQIDNDSRERGLGRAATIRTVLMEHYKAA